MLKSGGVPHLRVEKNDLQKAKETNESDNRNHDEKPYLIHRSGAAKLDNGLKKTENKKQMNYGEVYDFIKKEWDALWKAFTKQEDVSVKRSCQKNSDINHFLALLQWSHVCQGSTTSDEWNTSLQSCLSEKQNGKLFCRSTKPCDSLSDTCGEGPKTIVSPANRLLMDVSAMCTTHWVKTLRLGIASLISYTFLLKSLQLLRENTPHPLLLFILNHSSTSERLCCSEGEPFLQGFTKNIFNVNEKRQSEFIDSQQFLQEKLLSRQKCILEIVAPSFTPSLLCEHICSVQQFLHVTIPWSFDILLSLLLHRRLASSLGASATINVENGSFDTSVSTLNSVELVSLLLMEFSNVDLEELNWSQSSLKREVFFILTNEIKSYCDCINLVASFETNFYEKLCHEWKIEMTENESQSKKLDAHFLPDMATSMEETRASNSWLKFHVLSVLKLHYSINFHSVQECLWLFFKELTMIDVDKFNLGSRAFLYDEEKLDKASEQDNQPNVNEDLSEDILSLKLRLCLLLSTYSVGCVTAIYRFAYQKLDSLPLIAITNMCEFITHHSYAGCFGRLTDSSETSLLNNLLASNPSLLLLVQDLRCACLSLVIVLHQHSSVCFFSDNNSDTSECDAQDWSSFDRFHKLFEIKTLEEESFIAFQPVVQVTHALLCAELTQRMQEFPIPQEDVGDESYNQQKELCDYAVSVIPEKCSFFFEILKSLRFMSPAPSITQSFTKELFKTTPHDSATNLLLWTHSNNSLPSFVSENLLPEPVDRALILLDSNNNGLCRSYSLAGSMRHVFFDLIVCFVKKVQLCECWGVHNMLDFCEDLFSIDDEIARRCYNDEQLMFQNFDNRTCFGDLVINQYLLKYLPYSLSSLLQMMSSLMPQVTEQKCTSKLLQSTQRFQKLMQLLISPLEKICFPPLFSSIRPIVVKRQPLSTNELSIPLKDNFLNLSTCHEMGDYVSTDAKFERNKRTLASTPIPETYRKIEDNSDEKSFMDDDNVEKNTWAIPTINYYIQEPIHLESVLLEMLGLDSSDMCQKNTTVLKNQYGQIISMPIEHSSLWSSSTCSSLLEGYTSPLPLPKDFVTQNVELPVTSKRRYCGCLWAVGVLTLSLDSVQNFLNPIDSESITNFMHRFKERREEKEIHTTRRFSEGFDMSMSPNPFSPCPENFNQITQEAWLAFQLFSLSPGDIPPYTIQWDIASTNFSLLHLLWVIMNGLLEEIRKCPTVSSSQLCSINYLVQILLFFGKILSTHSMTPLFFSRFLCPSTQIYQSPTKLFLQLYSILCTSVNLVKLYHLTGCIPNPIVLLLITSLNAMKYVMVPVNLEDIKQFFLRNEANHIITFLWTSVCQPTNSQCPPYLQTSDCATNCLYIHWLFRLLSSSLSGTPLLDNKPLPILPMMSLMNAVKQCVEFVFSPELSCSLTTAALHLCTLLLELTPFSAWPCSAFNEALITSQITRETVNVLVRSQNGMEGDWNIVNTFVENYENDFWEILSSILPSSAVYHPRDSSEMSQNSLIHFRTKIMTEMNSAKDFQTFNGLLFLVFNVAWNQACSSLHGFQILERTYLLRQIMKPLCLIIQSLTHFNSYNLDSNCETLLQASKLPPDCISNTRKMQKNILCALWEHNILTSLASFITFEGCVMVSDSFEKKKKCIRQCFFNTLFMQAYIFDLLSCHKTHNILTSICHTYMQNYLCGTGALDQTKAFFNECIVFFMHLSTTVHSYASREDAIDVCKPSLYLEGVDQFLNDIKGAVVRNSTPSSAFLYCSKSSLASNDLFEQIDHRFMLDMMYEQMTRGWSFPVNFLMSLILSTTFYGDGVISQSSFLIHSLTKGSQITSSEKLTDKQCDVPCEFVVPYLMIPHPSELQVALSKSFESSNETCTRGLWSVLIFMEKTLVNFSIHTIIAAPAHLSLLFFPFINIRQKHNATVTVSSHVKLLPQIIPLFRSFVLRQDTKTFYKDSPVWEDMLVFCMFWLTRFLFWIEITSEDSPIQHLLTLDTLWMVTLSLDMLCQLFSIIFPNGSCNFQFLNRLALTCEQFFQKFYITDYQHLSPKILQMTCWVVLRKSAQYIVYLWAGFKKMRYETSNCFPSSDVSVTEALLGRIAFQSSYTFSLFQEIIAGTSACAYISSSTVNRNNSLLSLNVSAILQAELSFLCYPHLVRSFSFLLRILSTCFTMNSADYEKHQVSSKLNKTPPPSNGIKKSLNSVMLHQLLNLPDFVSFLQFIMGDLEMVTFLFQDENCVLLPSSLASQLCPMWFSMLQARELFDVLPSPLCTHCSTSSHYPFPMNSTRSIPFDCSLVNQNISFPNTSQKIFSNLLTLLFGATDSTLFHESTSVTADKLVSSVSALRTSDNCFMGYRGMVLSLSFFFFGNHLWHKVIEKYLNTNISSSLSVQQVKEYMLDTFGLIELMSVLLVEFDILWQKEKILIQFTRLYQIARDSPMFLMHLDLLKDSDKKTSAILTKFVPFKVFLSPTLSLLHLVLSAREDLNGRGRDFLFCPSSTDASLTYVGALLDFVIQQFTGNWHLSESLLKQDSLTFPKSNNDLSESNENAMPTFLHVEPALPKGSSFCISSLSQEIPDLSKLSLLQDSAIDSLLLTCGLPNIFQLTLLQNDSNQTQIHSLLCKVLQKLCCNCSTTIQLHMSASTRSPCNYGFQNFTDFCRAVSLCHLILRYWFLSVTHHVLDPSELDQMITPLVTIFDTHLTDLSTATTTLLKSLVIYKEDLNTLAQLLYYHSRSPCERQNTFHFCLDTARPAYFLMNVTAPILLLSLCCTILNLIKNSNVVLCKRTYQAKKKGNNVNFLSLEPNIVSNAIHNGKKVTMLHFMPFRVTPIDPIRFLLSYCFIFLDKQEPEVSLIEQFLITLEEKKSSDMHLTYRLMILLENISKLPANFSKAIDAAHLQSRQPTGLMDDMIALNPAYRSIWVPLENYTQRFTVHISLIGLAFLNLVLRCPIKLDQIEMSSIASHLYRLPGIQQFTRRLHKLNSYKSTSNQRYSLHKPLQSDDYWRPVYERFFANTKKEKDQVFGEPSTHQQEDTHPCRPLRSNAHVMWCRCLAQISLFNGTSIVHCILKFKDRFHFIATTVTQSTQLGVLEEFFLLTKLLAKMPPLEQIVAPTDKESILSLVFITLKTVSQLTQLCLARGQIEMSELFKPFSPREVAAANISDAYLCNMEKMTNETLDYSTPVLTGQPALVPSIYHQRVLVLILKIIQNVLTCLRVLQLENMTHLDFNLSKIHLNNARSSMGSSAFTLLENSTSVFGDIFETLFHDVLDIGRIILQSLEDLPKAHKRVFNGICTKNNSSLLVPISLDLRCAKRASDSIFLDWQKHTTSFEKHHDDNTLKQAIPTSYDSLAFPAASSTSRVEMVPKTPDPTTHLTSKNDITRHRVSVSKLASSSLQQSTAIGHARKFSNNCARPCCPLNVFQRLLLFDDITMEADTILNDCLPMCVTFASLVHIMETIVALSVFFAFTCFQKLTCLTSTTAAAVQGTTVLSEITLPKGVNQSNDYHSVFEWPSVVRRLTEFFSTLQNTGIERFDSLNNVIKKMMKVISLRLGDDPKTLQKEF